MVKSKVSSTHSTETAYGVLLSLLEGEKRFNQLIKEGKKASVARILPTLINQRYVKRRVVDYPPPIKTFYSLTDKGKKFLQFQKERRLTKVQTELNRLRLLD